MVDSLSDDSSRSRARTLAVSSLYGLFRPKSGGRSRFHGIVEQLTLKGHQVFVLQPRLYKDQNDSGLAETRYYRTSLGKITFATLCDVNPNFAIELLKAIRDLRPQIIQVSFPSGIIIARLVSKVFVRNTRIVYDSHNVESDVFASAIQNRLLRLLLGAYVLWIEKLAVRLSHLTITVSESDRRRLFSKFAKSRASITVIPNGVSLGSMAPTDRNAVRERQFTAVFHGSHFHPPNREAADLILTYIAPRVQEVDEDVEFLIAGEEMPKFKKGNVSSMGLIDDIPGLLATSDVAVVPILNGGGTRVKILDYMAMGLAIVTTKKGVEGIEVENFKHALIVDRVDEDFVKAILTLKHSPELRFKLGLNAKELVREKYDWDKTGDVLCRTYEHLVGASEKIPLDDSSNSC